MKNKITIGNKVRIKKECIKLLHPYYDEDTTRIEIEGIRKDNTISENPQSSKYVEYDEIFTVLKISKKLYGYWDYDGVETKLYCVIGTEPIKISFTSYKEIRFGICLPIEFLELDSSKRQIEELEKLLNQEKENLNRLHTKIEDTENTILTYQNRITELKEMN